MTGVADTAPTRMPCTDVLTFIGKLSSHQSYVAKSSPCPFTIGPLFPKSQPFARSPEKPPLDDTPFPTRPRLSRALICGRYAPLPHGPRIGEPVIRLIKGRVSNTVRSKERFLGPTAFGSVIGHDSAVLQRTLLPGYSTPCADTL